MEALAADWTPRRQSMESAVADPPRGLAGVAVTITRISEIDGARGELRYRGYAIESLAMRPFLEVVGLVIDGELPDDRSIKQVEGFLSTERAMTPAQAALLSVLPRDTHPMTMLEVALPLGDSAEQKRAPVNRSRADQRQVLLALAAKVPTLVAAWLRIRVGLSAIDPDPALPIHADFLRMLTGKRPMAEEVALLDATQILQMEHGLNASTFAARVVASTLAPMSMALSAAVAALFGPLHGGADEAAYKMALAIGDPDGVPAWVDATLARKEKIMGLGHREYRVVDPRAVVLRELAHRVAAAKGLLPVLRTLSRVDDYAAEHFAKEGKAIRANVEFYKGAVFASLGLPPDAFTALFVMARIYGWGAHILELWDDHALYRPSAIYRGEPLREIAQAT